MSGLKRESKYEALRIIAMLAIILNHTPCSKTPLPLNLYIHDLFYLGGQFGVNLFVIIGAWFLCDSRFTTRRILRIMTQMVFYSLVLDLVCIALGYSFTVKSFAKSFSYWFCFGYVIMLAAAPLIGRIPSAVRKVMIVIGFAVASVVTCLGIIAPDLFVVRLFLKGVFIGPVWFCFVLLTITELKPVLLKGTRPAFLWGIGFVLAYAVMYAVLLATGNSSIREVHSPVCFASALFVFEAVRRMKIRQSPVINRIAGYAFGAYLFQSHQILKSFVREDLFRFTYMSEHSSLYGLEAILSLPCILLATAALETIRTFLVEKTFIGKAEKAIADKCDELIFKLARGPKEKRGV